MRRKFYELADSSPVAAGVLRRIALLYAIEDEVRGSSAQQRQTARADRLKLAVARTRFAGGVLAARVTPEQEGSE